MKHIVKFILLPAIFLNIWACSKHDNPVAPVTVATLTTSAVTSILKDSAVSGGTISSDGGASVTARGVCWGTTINPTITNNKTSNGSGTGAFSSALTGLTPNTNYHVRAYATNSAGTAYGNDLSFTTLSLVASVPVLTTQTLTLITDSSAQSGGNISSDGGATITARGVCWNTSSDPTIIKDSITTDGNGIGVFASNLHRLKSNTYYYVRSYATNSAGTGYGNIIQFQTSLVFLDSLKAGLVAYFPFNGSLADSSGDNNNGIANGTLSYTADHFGKPGSALLLGSGYVTTDTFFQFQKTSAFSISVWFTKGAASSSGRLVSTECPEGNFRIASQSNTQYIFAYTSQYVFDTVAVNTWNHLVYNYNNRQINIYKNGLLLYSGTDTSTEAIHYCAPFTIGAKASAGFDLWQGSVDELRIYNRDLTIREINYLYTH
jgi:Concanavalin A-like lectin/glucanases superfamily